MQEFSLDKYQHEVVYSNQPNILCLAGAGAGKTFTMITRINRLVDEGVNPESILVLTFTRAAAYEMENRYIKMNPSCESSPEFRTFHGFCYSILAKDENVRNELGYSDIPDIAAEETVKEIKAKVLMQIGSKLPLSKLSKCDDLKPKELHEFDMFKRAYTRLLRKDNIITYDELCSRVCDIFVDDNPAIFKYKERYKYIFIDEFQDTDSNQWNFAKSFVNSKLFVCGDALQAIYAFRNADSSIIKSLSTDSSWQTYKLPLNYRSTKQICEFANGITEYADTNYRIDMISSKDGPDSIVYKVDDIIIPGKQFSKSSIELCTEFAKTYEGSTAVIARTNAQVDEIASEFTSNSIPYMRNESDNYILNVLRIAKSQDDRDKLNWLASALNSEEYTRYIRDTHVSLVSGHQYSVSNLLQTFKNTNSKIFSMAEDIDRVSTILNTPELSNNEKIDSILTEFNIDLGEYLGEDVDNIGVVEWLTNQIVNYNNSARVYIGTIHSVKGLEYDNVIVLGVDGKSFRLTNEENNNLYYVAVTRAKTNLAVVIGD